jgi:hypothetical protein
MTSKICHKECAGYGDIDESPIFLDIEFGSAGHTTLSLHMSRTHCDERFPPPPE